MKKILVVLAFLAITALLVKAAYIDRGYISVGGEWLVWVIPMLVWTARKEENNEIQ